MSKSSFFSARIAFSYDIHLRSPFHHSRAANPPILVPHVVSRLFLCNMSPGNLSPLPLTAAGVVPRPLLLPAFATPFALPQKTPPALKKKYLISLLDYFTWILSLFPFCRGRLVPSPIRSQFLPYSIFPPEGIFKSSPSWPRVARHLRAMTSSLPSQPYLFFDLSPRIARPFRSINQTKV